MGQLDTQGLNDEKKLNELENDSSKIGMYAFYDLKAKRFDTPFFCQNDMFAGRHYRMVVDSKDTMLNKFSDDFDVYRLGFIDYNTGLYIQKQELIIVGKNRNLMDELNN